MRPLRFYNIGSIHNVVIQLNKRTTDKVFKRAQDKVRHGIPLTTLEDKVWKERNEFFLRVATPIINELFDEEIAEGKLMERVIA